MKRKSLISSLAVALVLMFVLLSNVHAQAPAHPSMPASYNCTAGCTSFEYWNGLSYGGLAKFTIDDPGFNTTNGYYMKFLRLGNQSDSAHLDIGEIKNNSSTSGPYCGGSERRTQYFIYSWDINLHLQYHMCELALSSELNTEQTMSAQADVDCNNEGDGLRDEMFVGVAGVGFCVDTETAAYNRIILQAEIQDSVIGHQVWGGKWINSSWVDNNYAFKFQTRLTDAFSHQGAMRMYWQSIPNSSNQGGEMRSCVYEVYSGVCNYGS